MSAIEIDPALCTGCGICVDACSGRVYAKAGEKVPAVDARRCWNCGHCVAACPAGAIRHDRFPLDQCERIPADGLPDWDVLAAALKKRRSIRAFKDQPVPRDLLERLLDISRFAPTGHNVQNVDWMAVDSRERIREWSGTTAAILHRTARLLGNPLVRFFLGLTMGFETVSSGKESAKALASLAPRSLAGEDPIFYDAPVVLIAHVPAGSYFGRDDAVHALYNVELAAERLGLGSCQMGYFKIALDRDRRFRDSIGLPLGRSPEAALAVGFPKVNHLRAIPRRKPSIRWGS